MDSGLLLMKLLVAAMSSGRVHMIHHNRYRYGSTYAPHALDSMHGKHRWGEPVAPNATSMQRRVGFLLTCTTSAPVSRKAVESPTLAMIKSHPTTTATVAVVPDTCTDKVT